MPTSAPDGFLVTTRYGGTGTRGSSAPPYDSLNLGLGVGDDPDVVAGNRSELADSLGIPPGHLIWMSQVHGTRVAEVTGPAVAPIPGTDALVSAAPDIALAVLAADCVPLLAADRLAGVIGAAHAGRKGAAAGVAGALIGSMMRLGARPSDIAVLVGPAICGRCYEVPAAMRSEVEADLPGSACVTAAGTPGLDLRAGIGRQLRSLRIGAVHVDQRCTREDPELFSHRRSALTGRFAAVIRQ